MDTTRRTQLIRQRAVAKSVITRMQTYIETGDREVNDIQVRFDELPNIRGLLETYPTFGREKETGLLGALDT